MSGRQGCFASLEKLTLFIMCDREQSVKIMAFNLPMGKDLVYNSLFLFINYCNLGCCVLSFILISIGNFIHSFEFKLIMFKY